MILGYFVVLLSLLFFSIIIFILYKVRKIHLATYILLDNVAAIRRETENLFAQIQALLALERKLNLAEALPPMRGWVGSPDFLLTVANEVLARKPQITMECSSGVSTLVIARCLQLNGTGHMYSLEHDIEYASKTRKLLDKYGLTTWATVLDAPLQTKYTDTPWYDENIIPDNLSPIEMLIVDGPPSQTAPLARFPALPRLIPRMAERYIVIIDDANRDDEIEMIKRWRYQFPHLKEVKIPCEKGLVLLQSEETR